MKGEFIGILMDRFVDKTASLRTNVARLDRPVFVSGFGQSGTHLIVDVLSLSNGFAFTGTYGPRKKGLFDRSYSSTATGRRNKPIEGILHYWSGLGHPWERPGEWKMHAPLRLRDCSNLDFKEVRNRYARAGAMFARNEQVASRRILDKMPTYILMTEVIDAVFPDAEHVFVVRDPRAIWRSVLHRWRDPTYDPRFKGYPSGFYGNIFLQGWEGIRDASTEERIAFQINRTFELVENLRKDVNSRIWCLCFEEFCEEPGEFISDIEAFFDVEFDKESKDYILNNVRKSNEILWPKNEEQAKRFFTNMDIINSVSWLNDLAFSLGYDKSILGKRIKRITNINSKRK